MGGGRFSTATYSSLRATRTANSVSMGVAPEVVDFAYSQQAQITQRINPTLDPRRIRTKPFQKLESRDSEEHPQSNAILVSLDVTGSNITRAIEAQKRLPNLMTMLEKYISDPQVAVAANDDYRNGNRSGAVQVSDFESDNRIDDRIRDLWLVSNGGAGLGESYDLVMYAAAYKTVLDCFEKRGKKGYFFMYADEPFFTELNRSEVEDFFGDKLQARIPIETLIEDVRKLYEFYVIWPQGAYTQAYDQFVKLLGSKYVLTLQDPNLICECIGSVIAMNEAAMSPEQAAEALIEAGVSRNEATTVIAGIKRKFKFETEAR